MSPEELAREKIDVLLQQCGWVLQNRSPITLSASLGVAIREALLKEPEAPSVEETEELGGEPTSPANEVSTVLYLPLTQADGTKKHFLLTADAGTEAFGQVVQASAQSNHLLFELDWMQLPHHGSRRNLNVPLINYFSPRTAFVSAEGSKKHPSVKLANAVKSAGGVVYSTHYKPPKTKGAWLRQACGTVPPMNVSSAIPLWD